MVDETEVINRLHELNYEYSVSDDPEKRKLADFFKEVLVVYSQKSGMVLSEQRKVKKLEGQLRKFQRENSTLKNQITIGKLNG